MELKEGEIDIEMLLGGVGTLNIERLKAQMDGLTIANEELNWKLGMADLRVRDMEDHVQAAEVHGEATKQLREAIAPLLCAAVLRLERAQWGAKPNTITDTKPNTTASTEDATRHVTTRLVVLSEEVRRQKLELLKLRRVNIRLREERSTLRRSWWRGTSESCS